MTASTLPTHYDLLDIACDAAPDELRRAYRRAAQRHHPDRQPGDASAPARMARINEAYAVLSHPARRASYDQWLRARHARVAAQAAADAARPSRFAASWPWGLVAITIAVSLGTLGAVLYHASVPSHVLAAQQPRR